MQQSRALMFMFALLSSRPQPSGQLLFARLTEHFAHLHDALGVIGSGADLHSVYLSGGRGRCASTASMSICVVALSSCTTSDISKHQL